MIPASALNKIRSVNIYYWPNDSIFGFSFFDKDGAILYKIGWIEGPSHRLETVLLKENEVIVGVVAKLHPHVQTCYTDF